ncbi:MAG: undecaprenyl-diphosphate phosphatase [Acholeplasmataceae bacterium]
MQNIIELLKYILIGVVQGITEILPISSSGHSAIVAEWLNITTDFPVLVMLMHSGSFIAVFLFFRKEVIRMFSGTFLYLVKNDAMYKEDAIYFMKVLIACIPIGIVGFFFRDYLSTNLLVVGISLVLTAGLLLFVYLTHTNEWTDQITWKSALLIGAVHTFGIIPGVSRSATVLSSGIKQGIKVKIAVNFSFMSYILLSVPIFILGVVDAMVNPEPIDLLGYTLAFIFSFIFSYLGIRFLYNYLKVKYFLYFGIYCFIIGAIAIITFVL